MKRIFTLLFFSMIILSYFALAQTPIYGLRDISLDTSLVHSDARSVLYVPASEKLDGDELANIIVPTYKGAGGFYVFKQVAKNSLQFKVVYTTPFKGSTIAGQNDGQQSTPRCVAYGDLDGNGKKEIWYAMGRAPADTVLSELKNPRGLYVYECVGRNDYGTAYYIPSESFDPATATHNFGRLEGGGLLIADIDNDGQQELLISSNEYSFAAGRCWVVSVESGTIAQKTAKLKVEYEYTALNKAFEDDGFTAQTFALADVDGDGIKEVVVAGSQIVGSGGGIGFFKATGKDTYHAGSVIHIPASGPGDFWVLGTQIGVIERPEGAALFFYADETGVVDRRVYLIDGVSDIDWAGEHNKTLIGVVQSLTDAGGIRTSYSGIAASKSDPLENNPNGFDVYVPWGTYGIYNLKYNGTGDMYQQSSYTLYKIFDGAQVWKSGTDFGTYKLYAPPDDINGNGRKKLIANNQLSRISGSGSTVADGSWIIDTLISTGVEYHKRNPFWILEYGLSSNGVIEVQVVTPIMPEDYILEQNYPNPFNPSTTIRFTLPTPEDISLIIYDINGKEVTKLIDKQRYETGTFEKIWNGKNKDGRNVSSGTYFCKLKWGNFEKSMKMSLVK